MFLPNGVSRRWGFLFMKVKKQGLLWVNHPEFKRREVFCTPPKEDSYKDWSLDDISTLGKCVVTYSDPEGPMGPERDITRRQKGCLEYIGVAKNSIVHDEVMNVGRLFLQMTHAYYEMIYDVDYELWISSKMQLHYLMSKLRSPTGADKVNDTKSLMRDIEDLKVDVQRREAKVFKDMTLMKRVAEHITGKDKFDGYAEEYAVPIDDLISQDNDMFTF